MIKTHINLSEINLQAIVAMDSGGGIGIEGKLPWPPHKEDFKRFKEITKDSVVIMGRKTYEEIAELRKSRAPDSKELLPGRVCVVVSSKEIVSDHEIAVANSLSAAVQYHYDESKPIFVIGGLQLYTEALPYLKTLYVTQFDQYYECDRRMPLSYMSKHFNIVEGTREDDGTMFLKCQKVDL